MKVPFVSIRKEYSFLKRKINAVIPHVINNESLLFGRSVGEFEKKFAKYIGSRYCLTLNSGTDALILGLRALQLSPGDEVLLPTHTFFATALAAVENGLKPVLVDTDINDFGMDLTDLKSKITNRTKAIIIVHLYGQAEKMEEIQQIISKDGRKIHLIEDACQAHGALYKGKRAGSFGTFSAFSFYPTKNLGGYGDGGAVTTSNTALAKRLGFLRQYGQIKKYYHSYVGINSRMDTIQAAILNIKLAYLNEWNHKRQQLAKEYNRILSPLTPDIKIPVIFPERRSVYHLYVVRALKQQKLISYLTSHGVTTLIHYPKPIHLQKALHFLGYKRGMLPNSEKLSKEIISLPLHHFITLHQIRYVARSIQKFYQ
ncbi:DegT/DnrJ/EryC1/StrS family aminotransferase [Candidatus Roizmanbacteria bacterium]|nr:DegT/DnrJ/EryC1/StrS family aminotransferase [Candidatus Roizmanbacteria bacterium]